MFRDDSEPARDLDRGTSRYSARRRRIMVGATNNSRQRPMTASSSRASSARRSSRPASPAVSSPSPAPARRSSRPSTAGSSRRRRPEPEPASFSRTFLHTREWTPSEEAVRPATGSFKPRRRRSSLVIAPEDLTQIPAQHRELWKSRKIAAHAAKLYERLGRAVKGRFRSFRELYRTFDVDKDGRLNFDEFYGGLQQQLGQVDAAEARVIFERTDRDGSGFLTFEKFVSALEPRVRVAHVPDPAAEAVAGGLDSERAADRWMELKERFGEALLAYRQRRHPSAGESNQHKTLCLTFKEIDEDQGGIVSYEQMFNAIGPQGMNLGFSAAERTELVLGVDEHDRGYVNMADFVGALKLPEGPPPPDTFAESQEHEAEQLRTMAGIPWEETEEGGEMARPPTPLEDFLSTGGGGVGGASPATLRRPKSALDVRMQTQQLQQRLAEQRRGKLWQSQTGPVTMMGERLPRARSSTDVFGHLAQVTRVPDRFTHTPPALDTKARLGLDDDDSRGRPALTVRQQQARRFDRRMARQQKTSQLLGCMQRNRDYEQHLAHRREFMTTKARQVAKCRYNDYVGGTMMVPTLAPGRRTPRAQRFLTASADSCFAEREWDYRPPTPKRVLANPHLPHVGTMRGTGDINRADERRHRRSIVG